MNRPAADLRVRNHAQLRVHSPRLAETLLIEGSALSWWVRYRVEDQRDFGWSDEHTPDSIVTAGGPASEDANRDRHRRTLVR
jgi:hypothetical protein